MTKKILVVDDERTLVSAWGTVLRAHGFNVITAYNGPEDLARALREKPDLLLLDVMMPGPLTGYHVYEKLREDPHAKNIPVIILSTRKGMKDLFPPSELITFVDKSIDMNVLLAQVHQLLTAQMLGENKHVLILGIQDFVVHKIKEWFEKSGYKVTTASNEFDAIEKCERFGPKFFFCQFWGDPSALDAATVYKKVEYGSVVGRVSFYIYCHQKDLDEAIKIFPRHILVPYTDSKDLLTEIEKNIVR